MLLQAAERGTGALASGRERSPLFAMSASRWRTRSARTASGIVRCRTVLSGNFEPSLPWSTAKPEPDRTTSIQPAGAERNNLGFAALERVARNVVAGSRSSEVGAPDDGMKKADE